MQSTVQKLTLVLLASTSACTSLTTATDVSTAGTNKALTGIPYTLPMLQYEMKITRALTQCNAPGTKIPALEFAMTVEATPTYVSGETYVIDYRKLAGFTKISSLSLEFQEDSNILKSLNAQAEDRSAEIGSNLLKTAVGVASLASGIPMKNGAPSDLVPTGMLICAPGAQAMLDAVTIATATVKASGDKLKAATVQVDALTTRVGTLSDADKVSLKKKLVQQQNAQKALASAQAALANASEAISTIATVRWPRAMDVDEDAQEAEAEVVARLARMVAWTSYSAGPNGIANRCDDKAKIEECIGRKISLWVKLDRVTPEAPAAAAMPNGKPHSGLITASAQGSQGVFVRPPIQGRLLVCGEASAQVCGDNGPNLLLRTPDAQIPQMGTLRFLPFRNEMFQNNSLTLSLNKAGGITKIEYKELKAQGETLTAATLAAVSDLRTFADSRTAQREADATVAQAAVTTKRTSELAALQFELDRLQKQKALADLIQPPATTATAAVQAQTADTNARVALFQAMLAERDAQAALGL